uniref:Microtubule actin crosslinking factor 1 n=1 Tax=Taeniopygia guttata TaxID=59729 RepID=A0A674HI94_TAEGU
MPLSESSYLPPAAFVLSHVLGIAGVLYWRSRSREDERDRVQKKTFTKWVNKHLMKVRKHINDLYEDLRDGHNLISLLEVLSGVKLVSPQGWRSLRLVPAPAWCRASSEEEEDDDDEEPREKGRMRFHRLQNVQIALDFLKQRQVKLVNIRNDDITDGNPKLTLGLIWTIILHFQISDIYISGELGDMSAKEKLLLWTQKVTAGYIGLKCTNFSSCWSDGKMFNALIHRYRPDLVDMERVQIQSNRENLEQAFEIAERLGVTRLLDAEDVDVPSPDEKSVITYVSSIYDAFPKVPEGGEGISAIEVDSRWLEYQTRVESLISWIKQHTILMSDKSFPQNPVELKALYNQYIHFKETEIPAKEQEKGQIEELYKLLEVWIEFGRIKLPQGYHPNDVEEEWGKLIIEMLEREKLLRPAVERLELLLQIANKIQNGALSCEEKLTLAKNTLQADAAHLESGQPVQYESDVVVYLQECEGLLRQLQVDVQILRDENYYQLEELVFRIMRLQDELVTLRLECTNLYRKGHFSTLELVPTSTLSTTHLKGESLTKGLHTSSASWFRKPMTRTELVAISSSEDEGSLRFVYELLAWVEEMQMRLERAEWGTDLPSVESQLETQRHIHASVEDLGSSVKEARMYEGKMSPNFRASYTETLGKLETQYCKLMETSSFRLRHLQSLHGFVSRATAELIWLNEKEEEELAYDWSDNNPNIAAKKNYFSELTAELEEKQDIFRSLQDTAELLSLENHPAKQTVEAYSAAVHTQWQWIKQLCLCVEQHVKENAAYFQFFSDARELETYLRNLQDSIKRKYSCDHNTSLTRLEDLLQDSMDEKEQLIQSKSSVASLVGRSKTIVQLRPRNPEQAVKSTIPIRAVCDYRQIEITICRNDECVLEDNSQRTKWKVISPTGNEAMVPSVCFLIPPPNKEAIEMASRVEQLYQKVMALWHQLHMNTKSLISWNYLRKDIALVQSFSMEKLRSLAQGECQQALKSLQAHYEDFLQDSRDSELFSMSDRLRLEEEVESSKEHIRQLLESMENEDKDETLARSYLSELKNIRLRLEECEQRLVSRIQSPSSARADGDTIQENAIRMAEQERTQADLQQLQSELRVVSQRCCSFLDKAPAGPSTPHLRSELDLVVNKMEQTHGLSSIYLEKLKTVDIIIRSTQGAESLVKGYEVKLSQEEAVPADLAAIQTHRAALQQWLGEVKDKGSVFSTLEEEMAKAKEVGEQLLRLRQERSIDLERFQEKGSQLWDRWQRACAQIETRHTELESIQEVLSDYRQCHRALIQWIEEITAQQELMKPGQAEDSRVLSEQLSQQTALAAEIEKNQAKLDQCQKFSQQYSAAVKDYELQLMTYRAFVESQQKSPMKRRRMLSSSDAITQEFMDLRTRYTALVTLTTQHVKYISDALRRLEEEEKVVEEEKQEHVDKVKELLGWALGLKQSVQGRTAAAGSRELGDIEKSISEQQALNEELTAKKEQVSEAIKTSQIFLAKHSHKLSQPEKDQISAQIDALKETYQALCSNSTEQLQQLQSQLAQETEHKVLLPSQPCSLLTFSPQAVQKVSFCCVSPVLEMLDSDLILSLLFLFQGSEAVAGVIDLGTVEIFPVFGAMQRGLIDQDTGLALLEAQVISSDLVVPETSEKLSLEKALARNIIDLRACEGRQLLPVVAAIEEGRISESHGLPELLERCIIHQETGLRLLPVKQLAGGMVSLRSGREVSIFRAVQEGLIDRQVTIRLLEAHLFAGGIVDPRTGHRLTVDEAVRHNLIDQDLACTLLIRQLQTGGIMDSVTGERLTVDEALRKGLVAPRIALLVLESLGSFVGLLWPETGEIIPVADALEQGILSTELIQEVLSKRQLLQAVLTPDTTEVLSWQKAVERGVLEREVVKKLKSMAIPDVMASVQLAGSPSRSRHSHSSPGRSPTGQEEPLLRSDDEKLMFHLMTHSYINIHDGQKVLLVDAELNNLTKTLIQSQENESCAQVLENFEETQADGALESEPCNGVALQRLELQFAPSKGESEKILSPRTALENGEVVVGPESLLLEDAEDFLRVEEQEQISTEQEITRSEADAEFGKEHITFTAKDKHQVKLLMPEPPSDLDSGLIRETEEVMVEAEEESKPPAVDGVEGPEHQKRELESGAVVVKSEISITMGVPESRDSLKVVAERSQGVREPEREAEEVREVYLPKEGTAENGVLEGEEIVLPARGEAAPAERQSTDMETVLKVEEGEWEGVLGDEGVEEPSLPAPEEQEAEDTLEKLLMQLQSGGIIHEQTGRALLLDEAVASGVVSGHTAVKLMERMKMFSGFFDSQVCESLTTEDVIEEGLMDEKLLQKVLASDKAISGVLDPGNNFVYSIKDAAAVGLLDKETAMRILEGQVVTGGIVDLKRGKKVSVTLASNLGLIEPTGRTELVKLEKASKGKGTDEVTRQKLINLQAETSGIADLETKRPLTVAESVEKGLLEKEEAFQLLTKQVADGGIIHHMSGMRLSVDSAMKHGLINPDLCKELRKAESVVLQDFVHPATKEKLPLPQAVSLGLVSSEFQRKVQEIQAESGSILDPASGQRLALSQAVQEGLVPQQVVEKALASPEMREGIVDPETCMVVPYSEFLKKCKIDIESGQRYLEVHPFQAIRDEVTGTKLPCAEAVRLGKVDPLPALRLLQAQADSGGVVEGSVSQRLSLRAAVEQGVLDEPMAKVIATNQLRAGGIVDAPGGKRLTVKEAVGKGLISQKLAAGLRDLEIPDEEVGSEVCKVGKRQLSQEKVEKLSPKEEEKIERLGLEKEQLFLGTEVFHREEDGEERRRRREFVSEEGVVAGGEGAVVTSGQRERVTSVVQETPAALRESVTVGPGKGGMGPNTLSPFLPTFEALISCLIVQIKFSKKMCLEHDQRLISYLSMLRDIEMRIKRVQPAEQNLAALHDLRQQAEALGAELQELSFSVNQELDAVQRIVANPPEEVPEQLLKALEKDAKNLQKSLGSASEVLQSRLQNLRGAAEAEKAKILAHHEALQGRLQELLSWVSGTAASLGDGDLQPATDASSLSHCLQHYEELKEPLAATKAELDATAFDIQFLISEHAQDLTPQQSRQLLRLLNELQKAFRDLSERVTARLEVLQVCLQQVEQTEQVKTLQEQQAARARSLAELSRWLGQAEDTLAEQQRAEGDLPALQQRQSDVKELQRSMHSRAASFAGVLKSTEQFLEENKAKLEPGELAALQQDLQRAKEQYQSLQERTEVAQKELESAVSAAVQQETEKVKAAKELEENSNKIDSLLDWVASLEEKGALPEYRPHPVHQGTGTPAGKSTGDVPDGHAVGADSAAESLDEHYERLKAQHQELLSQQQDVILAWQAAQAFLDKQGPGEERERLRARLAELRERYPASLARAEARLKRAQLLREELQKFLRDHGEFEAWLEQAEQDLQGMCKGDSDPASLRQLLRRQGSFSEDVISHKGDLRFVTMSGEKFLDGDAGDAESQLLMSRRVVKSKLEDATQRYTTLHSKCSKLGSHLNTLLDHYQQFQEVAESLRMWLQESEAALGKLLSETVSSDLAVLQKQLASTKQLQGDLAEHQVPVEKLQKAARTLLDIQGEPAPDHGHIQETTDAIVSRFQSLSQQMSERSDLLQKSIAQSQSVQESLESLLQSVAEVEKNLEKDQPAVLSSASIQDSLATSVKLKQDIARQRSCLEATREMVTRFTEAADSPAASALQDKLAQVTEHFGRLCQQQQEREDALKGLLPTVEQYEQLWERLQQFTESRTRMLASGNQPDRGIAHFSQHIQELNSELRQHQEDLATLEHLAEELSSCGFAPGAFQQQEKLQSLKKDFLQLQKVAKDREKDASSCQEQLDEFRDLVGAVRKWLRESEGKIPPAETSLGTQELQQHRQQIQDLLEEWKGKGPQVEEIGRRGTLLENLIVEITAPSTPPKAGATLPTPGGSGGSVNGYHTCKDLTEIQCDVSEVRRRYQALGAALQERQQQLSAMLDRMQEVQEEASSMLKWLESKERMLSELEASSSPTKTETMRAQAEHNKAFLAELEQNSGKIQKVKEALSGLLEKYPDSPEAANWKKMQEDLNCRWERASQATAARQQKLEESASQLATFQATEAQLRPWLMEKELMMSVLGPLSIDPNMLNAQKQQVQFMLKEFEARRQQHEQLNQAAQSILTGPGDVSPSTSQVRDELQGVNQKWSELTERLNSRSSQIDQAIVKSTQYQELLQGLSEKVKAVGQRLSSQSAISTQPDAVKQQLEETSEIRSDLEQLEEEISEAQNLCDDLSVLIGEQYLKDELRKRLETVALPLKGLEDLAADRMNRLQTALASSQQFQHMFDELRTWLDDKRCQQAQSQPISAKLERLQSQIQEQEEFQKSLNQHSGSYEMIVAEGESLLLSVQPGEEKTTLQNQLVSLKTHWEELSKQAADRHSKLKDCLQKAQKYQRHADDLLPWVEDCKARMAELEVTLDPVQLEATLLRSKAMLSDVEKRRSLLEMLNSAADILTDASQTDEDDIRDEKASINQKMDAITEELQTKTGSIEEMSQRLKEFQESFKNIEKKLEGAKHQLEIYDALGPQACSNKNLEKLRAQQEVLQTLEPQVEYLKNLTQGLVEDAPAGSDCSQLLSQAEVAQQDFKAVKQKVNDCCALMENKLEGIGQFNSRVREMFSQLADLDDELDSMGPIGRDSDSLQSQAEDVRAFLGKLQQLKSDIESSESECRKMLEDEGSPDLLGLKRELETLNKQCSKLTERGRSRQEQVETTLSRVEDFYSRLKELSRMTAAAEEHEALQWVVGTEVETINQQLADFKQFQKEQVDPLQLKLQQVNGVGQGLIQSAGKNCDVQGLEHDMEEINTRWNTLNKKVAQRVAQLQEALLHCGKFQDALEPLLSWLADTEELISNQKPPSAEYKVVKAQIQEQKLLQRLLDDRKATVEMIQAEGDRIAQAAEPADRDKIVGQLESLARRWEGLLGRAAARQKQLEDILVLAKQFHETTEPVSDWLSVTEKKLANSEPIGTQTAKIQQQISRHKALEEEIESHATNVSQALGVGQSLSSLSCAAEQRLLAEKLEALQSRYGEVRERCGRKAALLDQALANARLFGEEEVEVLNWLAEVEDKLGSVSIKDYKRDVLQKQHADQLALNEEIVNRKKNVDQAIRNGQALLKQTTGEEVLLIQEKLDGIKTRYSDITAASSKALRTLEQARQLATKFQSTHEELTGWMSKVEDELASSGAQSPAGEQIPQFQQRQKELKKEVMEHRLVLDTVNEVSRALLELVPWRAREGLDKLVSDTNERYKLVSDTIKQRVEEIDAAIQRSQQYEQAADAELAWVAETKRKLMALGPIRLEQDQTTAQLQVQKAFSIDIIRHKDSMDELFSQRNEIFGTCGEEQKALLQEKTESLVQQYEAVSQLNSERYARLERAQVLVNQFWETYEELNPWIEETQALISQLPPPAIDHEQLKQQQDDMRQLRESIAEHKPHIDKLLKIGPQLKDLNPEEGEMVQEKYSRAEALYAKIKEEVCQRALALDEAFSQSTQFHDKIEPMLETLEGLSSRLRLPPLIPAEVDKIRECISENKNSTVELEKLQPSFEALKRRGEELIARSQGADKDLAAKVIQDKLDQMVFFWEDIKARTEEREMKFLDVLELAEKFWYDMAALLTTIKDTQDIVHDLESPGIDPSIIKQQVEAAETIKEETDGLHEELEFIRLLGTDLIFACGETEKPEVKKSIDEMNNAWENLNKTWKERLEKLEEAMQSAVQYQDTLQAMFDWLDNAVIKLCNMSPVGTDLSTVKEQMNEMKEFKMEVYQQQIEMEKLNHQGELMLKKATDETDRDIIKEPLTELKHLWENLGEKIAHRQHKLEAALLALGQFQHALAELMAWLTHTEELLDAQKPINGDPKVIEVELAKHHVLKNDVLAHQATVETVNKAGNELLESSAGDDASSLRNRLEKLNSCWESVLQKTEEREQQLQSTLQQAQGFHGEIEDFLLWLTRMESQLSASKPTGGLPETAREQLNAHMELYSQLKAKEDVYSQLLAKGRLMLLNRDDSGSSSKTEQSVALLEQKWCLVSTKMEERKAKLEEALALATDFQNSLQDFINWLTLAEQSLNIAPPPSLILAAVLAQIDEHKVFANEVNAHRDRIIELDQTGNQLKFLSQKQDVVLIKNLLVSVQSRWEKVVQRSVERGRALDDARKRAKQFHEAWKKLIDWLEDAENHLDSELEISNDPDKIKLQLSKHKEFQKTLGGKQPVYDTTIRTGRALKEKALLSDDTQKLDNLLGEVRDKWDTVCGKSVERQHKLEEALLFSGQFMDALQALVDWLYKVEPQLAEDQPVHGDLDLVMNLMDAHKVFQKELGKRTGTVQVLKRSGRELIDNSRDDTTWVKVQLQELSNRWDTVCKLSVSKQTRLEQALKQAEEFRTAVHMLLEWLSEAEQSLRFRGALPDDAEALQALIDAHKEFMKKVEEKRVDVNAAVGMGEVILGACHPDCITTIKHWITIIRARFEEVLTWAKQHQQRLESALSELVANAELLEELLAWIQWAETTLIQRDQDPMPQNIDQVKALISEHQSFMEEMTRKQPDVDRVTKTYKRKVTEPPHGPFIDKSRSNRKCLGQAAPPSMPIISQSETKNPRINQLSARWQQVWLLALERQRKLNDALDRLEELKEFANFDFDVWRKKYMRWMNHKKSRVMDFFRRIDKDQDGKITRQEFIDGILASKFPTTKLEMTAVADIFDRDGDGYIDYYEFVAALHPNKDAYRPTTDADKIEDEVTRQVAQCKCAKRFQVEQIGENKYRFGDSQQLRLVRILRSTVMVRVGGGWMALDEFLVKNDPCRGKLRGQPSGSPLLSPLPARGRTNLELREKFILPEGASQGMTPFRSRGRRSKPSSRAASPTRSSSSASQSNHSCASMPSSPATPASGAKTPHHFSRCYDKPWLINSKAGTPLRGIDYSDFQLPNAEVTPSAGSKLKRPTFHSSRTSLAGDTSNSSSPASTGAKATRADPKKAASRPTSRAGSRTGSRASSRRGSDASDFDLLETQSACSDTSESSAAGGQSSRRAAKPSKIPTMSKKTPAATPKTPGPKR